MLIPRNDKLSLYDGKGNTIVEILKDVYSDYDYIPNFYEVKDACFEFMIDYSKHAVTYKGQYMDRSWALDILEDIMFFEGFIYEKDGSIINPRQAEMFPRLFDRESDEFE